MAKAVVTITGPNDAPKNITVGPNKVVVVLDATPDKVSGSGKMTLVGCTNGNQLTDAVWEGKEVYANCNIGVYIQPKSK